jgi:putative ABC transport system permease protein
METLLHDLRYAVRALKKSPGFTLVAVLTLALGIGTNTAIFSVIDTVLLKPLPYPAANRLYAFMSTGPQGSFDRASPTKFNTWHMYATAFEHLSAYRFTAVTVTAGDEPEQVPTGQVSAEFFRLFGASMIAGRTFSAGEDQLNGGRVVALSYGYWQRRFGSDSRLVGNTLSIGGAPYTVVGIVSPDFHMPEVAPPPDLWVPFQIDPHSSEQAHILWVAGRLKADRSIAEAMSQLRLAAEDFRRRYPSMIGPEGSFGAERYQDVLVRDVRPSLRLLVVAVGFVLLLACANLANLMLARAVGRKREIAVCAAIGAGRVRIARQLLTESLVLSLAGGTLGMFLGVEGIRALLVLSPVSLPRINPEVSVLAIDWRIVAFTITASILTGVGFGLVPVVQMLRTDLNATLKETGERSGGGFRQNKARSLLVGAQMTLASVLLVGAALLILTFAALRTVNPGFTSDGVLTMGMELAGARFSTTDAVAQFARDAERRLTALPGVVAAATTCCLPLGGKYGHLPFDVVGRPSTSPSGGGWVTASPGYFEVFKIPLRRGRIFTDRDTRAAPLVVVISESLARRYWPVRRCAWSATANRQRHGTTVCRRAPRDRRHCRRRARGTRF